MRRQEAFWARCRNERECTWYGLCGAPPPSMRDDSLRCFATSDADCAASSACESKGACSARDGACQVLTDADCARSSVCLEEGECRADHGACRALADADCTRQGTCVHRVRCSARDGKCVPNDESCRASRECKDWGGCGAFGETCEPRSADDCTQSERCREEGACALLVRDHRFCVLSDEGCRRSPLCQHAGRCVPGRLPCYVAEPGPFGGGPFTNVPCVGDEKKRPETCVATSTEDCERSDECASEGRCALGVGKDSRALRPEQRGLPGDRELSPLRLLCGQGGPLPGGHRGGLPPERILQRARFPLPADGGRAMLSSPPGGARSR